LQDTSRNFLCETVAHKEMYELFMRATMLQQTQYKLQQAQGCLEQMKELLEDIVAEHRCDGCKTPALQVPFVHH
jgi:hypothetical protein